ncbi:MAG TPA: PAS domain-containing protein, partial [Deltaproteobacteria bacterium]|nr:PAS domain-containing protein [Deltaproteobacteria bacterium]
MEVYWLGGSPPDLPGIKQTGTLDGIPEDGFVFIEDTSGIEWKSIHSRRVYLVSDLPVPAPLPAQVVGVIPRDAGAIDAIVTLCTEMVESYDLGDRLIGSLNEKELAVHGTQKALLRDGKRYRAIIRNATDLIFTLDPAGKITFSNETMKRYLKGGKDSLDGSALTDFVVDENRDSVTEMIWKGFRKGVPSKIDVRLR